MKTIEIWDKQSSINGCDAQTILNSEKWMNDHDVILIKEGDVVTNIENPSILKVNLKLEGELTSLEIGQAYIDYLEKQNNESIKAQLSLEEMNQQIDDINIILADMISKGEI